MYNLVRRARAGLVPLALAIGATGMALAAGAGDPPPEALSCEVQVTHQGGMIALEGVVHAPQAVQGSYRLRVSSTGRSGNADISQGGDFTAEAGGTVSLGRVTLAGDGTTHEASLQVTANGVTVECRERVGHRA